MAKRNNQKPLHSFLLSNLVHEEIKDYCRYIIYNLNAALLRKNKLNINELLDYFYFECKDLYETTGNFELTEEQIYFIITIKKQFDSIIDEVDSGNAFLFAIDRKDNLIFEFNSDAALKNFNNLKNKIK